MTTIKCNVQIVCCMILALGLVGLTSVSEAQETTKTALRVSGAAMASDQVQLWANEFTKSNPTALIVVQGSSAGKGFEALFDKHTDVAMASRVVLPDEQKKAAEKGLKLETKLIGYAGLAVITHPRNPVSELTIEQLKKIYTGQFTNWQDVGGPAEPIRALSRRVPESGGAVFFREAALHNEAFGSRVVMAETWHAIVKVCSAATDLPIGICPVMRLNPEVKAIAVKLDDKTPAVLPSLQTCADRTYPLVLPFWFYWDDKSADARIKPFVEFCANEGLAAQRKAK
ncbi:MAG: substrate-binding domain-containing protein [Thermodesulfobacteriota bacterium]